jgi:hypothetical protein
MLRSVVLLWTVCLGMAWIFLRLRRLTCRTVQCLWTLQTRMALRTAPCFPLDLHQH